MSTCPTCGAEFELSSISTQALYSEIGRRRVAKRINDRGPNRKGKRCPCGENTFARAKARAFQCCKLAGKVPRPLIVRSL